MSSFRRWCLAVLFGASIFSACSCPVPQGGGDGGPNTVADSGMPGSGTDGGGTQPGTDSGWPQPGTDSGFPQPGTDAGYDSGTPSNVTDPNAARDTDCDGLTDAEEISNIYPGGKKTDPNIADTDGDGIPDGRELGRTSSV
ncbi:MAG TPA: VWA domain-containing protein, partial [Myxococcaceae bacterium]|nr:VWA domain-containing protein [Myxococcaceae bacterium]